jgi:hypothetical protein
MRFLLDLLQGAGFGSATGLRPFLPALAAGLLALGDLGVDYDDTAFGFLEAPPFLVALLLGLIAAIVLERRQDISGGPVEAALAGIGIGLGALLGAGSLDDRHDVWWPGLLVGAAAAALAGATARSLFGRVRARLDADARAALPAYAELAAVLIVVACAFVEPAAVVVLVLVAWLLLAGRRRGRQKYAGLRILR